MSARHKALGTPLSRSKRKNPRPFSTYTISRDCTKERSERTDRLIAVNENYRRNLGKRPASGGDSPPSDTPKIKKPKTQHRDDAPGPYGRGGEKKQDSSGLNRSTVTSFPGIATGEVSAGAATQAPLFSGFREKTRVPKVNEPIHTDVEGLRAADGSLQQHNRIPKAQIETLQMKIDELQLEIEHFQRENIQLRKKMSNSSDRIQELSENNIRLGTENDFFKNMKLLRQRQEVEDRRKKRSESLSGSWPRTWGSV
ncbi:hypothetical protein QBC47DRAFT_407060 [Echria macrotheca]|uniref:Uncharacterized protein n=1 Tax=Echria macrotheca TaxID=438768 RepID=A0AAJ0F6R1_9PEZI|nr:hypothetical protein QBC47DRAFT_407060 [Echria macrotheca]